jgi:hypothetical protein
MHHTAKYCPKANSHLPTKAPKLCATSQKTYAEQPFLAQQQSLGNQVLQRMLRSGVIQAKLTVNPPDDEYEREADRVAEKVMSMPEPGALEKVQRACPECEEVVQRQPEEEEEEEPMQTKPVAEQITPLVQRQETSEEEEGAPVHAKLNDGRVQRQELPDEEEENVQTKQECGKAPQVSPRLEAQILSLKESGQPLSPQVRSFLSLGLGTIWAR